MSVVFWEVRLSVIHATVPMVIRFLFAVSLLITMIFIFMECAWMLPQTKAVNNLFNEWIYTVVKNWKAKKPIRLLLWRVFKKIWTEKQILHIDANVHYAMKEIPLSFAPTFTLTYFTLVHSLFLLHAINIH